MKKTILIFLVSSFLVNISIATVCKDGSTCPGISTCCLTTRGVGCCPYPNANCCGDGRHCCPQGYQCGQGTCYRQGDKTSTEESKNTPFTNLTFESHENKEIVTLINQDYLNKEIYYIINNCVVSKPDDSAMLDALKNCKEQSEDLEASQSCRSALIYFIIKRQFKASGCENRIDNLIKRLEM